MKYIIKHNKRIAYVGFNEAYAWQVCDKLARANPFDCIHMEYKEIETKAGGLYL